MALHLVAVFIVSVCRHFVYLSPHFYSFSQLTDNRSRPYSRTRARGIVLCFQPRHCHFLCHFDAQDTSYSRLGHFFDTYEAAGQGDPIAYAFIHTDFAAVCHCIFPFTITYKAGRLIEKGPRLVGWRAPFAIGGHIPVRGHYSDTAGRIQ